MPLSWRQRRAVRLMFLKTDAEIADELGVRESTIASWRHSNEFRSALKEEARIIRSATSMLACGAALAAARSLRTILEESRDAKLMLDMLKVAGAFEPAEDEPSETLEDVLRRLAERNASDNHPDG